MGAVRALGGRFFDHQGNEVGNGGQDLARVADFDMSGLDPRIVDCDITVICDVNNPLTGPKGATHIFGTQKGAMGEVLEQLEAGMENYRNVILQKLGRDMNQLPGAGAAGGLGTALVAFVGGTLRPGTETVLDLVNFDELLETANLVITGEGRIDGQTAFGKVPVGVASRCKAKNIPVIAVAGTMSADAHTMYDHGIDAIVTWINREMSLEEAMGGAPQLLAEAADSIFRFMKIGNTLNR
jgi:glycerate kinase